MSKPGPCIHCVLARQHPQDRDTYARHCHCAALNDAYAAGKRAGAEERRGPVASDKRERPTSEYGHAEIAIARALGRLRVDEDGYGWIRDMEPTPLARDPELDPCRFCRVLQMLDGPDASLSEQCYCSELRDHYAAGKRAGAEEMQAAAHSAACGADSLTEAIEVIAALPLEPEGE